MIEGKLQNTSTILAHATIIAAQVVGGASLVLLVVILFRGPIHVIDLRLSIPVALGLDGLLCLMFFVQHSGMVRQSFRERLETFVPAHFSGAIYAIASGVVLLTVLFFWQPTALTMVSVEGSWRWLLRGGFVIAICGFVWSIRALGAFDPFGTRPIKAHLRDTKLRDVPLTVRGPYKWVRHPLYAFALLLFWCYPDLTADRLLFNSMWTVWVLVATVLEERDLVSLFGEPYRSYQRKVPMLLPWRITRRG